MSRKTTQWFLSLQMTIFLLLIFVRGNEDAEDAYKNGKHLVLEYFLPINLPAAAGDVPLRREKRDVEGSGEDEAGFGELKESEDADNSTRSAIGMLEGKAAEGSGEVDDGSEMSSEEEREATTARIMGEAELLTMPQSDETTKPPNAIPEVGLTSTEMVFDRPEDFEELSTPRTEETSTEVGTTAATETTTLETTVESRENESTTPAVEETTKTQTTTEASETTTEPTTVLPGEENVEAIKPSVTEATTASEETTTAEPSTSIPVVIPHHHLPEEESTVPPTQETKTVPSTVVFIPSDVMPDATEGLPAPAKTPTTTTTTTTLPPVVEEVFKETKVDRKLEALPGNILQKENLSLAADPLLIVNTRLMDSEENVQLSSAEPKRLGAYIVIALILLSFMTLVGYITFKKRITRKRQEFESNQESNDTEKALLSLSDYKDSSELEENHLKNNEITPIVVKSNTQINRFEKNTNFSSPKNLNTIANEKNIEKDNVLKSTAENLTQVIIEDSPKDVEEDKTPAAAPGMERLIVKTRIDQDSIPKKAIIINRSSTGYMPIPQDN